MNPAPRPTTRPPDVFVATFALHTHQWRTDTITDGWRFAIQTCAVPGCGVVRRVKVIQPSEDGL